MSDALLQEKEVLALTHVSHDDRDQLEEVLQTLTDSELNQLRIHADRLAMYTTRFIANRTVYSRGNN